MSVGSKMELSVFRSARENIFSKYIDNVFPGKCPPPLFTHRMLRI